MMVLRLLLITLLVWCIPVAASAATFEVEIGDLGFSPLALTITEGDTVRWVNKSATLHGVISGTNGSPNGLLNSGLLNSGGAFEYNFQLSGDFNYFDAGNSSQTGVVTVNNFGLAISPPSNSLLFSSHATEIVIYAKLNDLMTKVSVAFDGVDVTGYLGPLSTFESSKAYDASIMKIPIPPFVLPAGIHTLNVEITMRSGLVHTSKATYNVIETIPAPGPPPFGWPCVESYLPCNP